MLPSSHQVEKATSEFRNRVSSYTTYCYLTYSFCLNLWNLQCFSPAHKNNVLDDQRCTLIYRPLSLSWGTSLKHLKDICCNETGMDLLCWAGRDGLEQATLKPVCAVTCRTVFHLSLPQWGLSGVERHLISTWPIWKRTFCLRIS